MALFQSHTEITENTEIFNSIKVDVFNHLCVHILVEFAGQGAVFHEQVLLHGR